MTWPANRRCSCSKSLSSSAFSFECIKNESVKPVQITHTQHESKSYNVFNIHTIIEILVIVAFHVAHFFQCHIVNHTISTRNVHIYFQKVLRIEFINLKSIFSPGKSISSAFKVYKISNARLTYLSIGGIVFLVNYHR